MHVVAMEPIHANVQLLRRNVVENGFTSQVTVLPFAAGHEGEAMKQYFTLPHNMGVCSGASTPLANTVPPNKQFEWVQERDLSTCVDEVVARLPQTGDTPRYIMKMDVEEAELRVLSTIPPAMWGAVDVLIVEVAGHNYAEVISTLQPHFDGGLQLGCLTTTDRRVAAKTAHLTAVGAVRTMDELLQDGNWRGQTNLVLVKQTFMTLQ